jgi:predicted GNAT superfamily acetyltransferase
MQDDLNRGDRSDRFEVTWDLTSERVTRASAIRQGDRPVVDLTDATPLLDTTADPEAPAPSATGRPPGGRAWVPVPMDHLGLRRRDPALAARWRDETAKAFTACFDAGLTATAVTRDGRYLFEPGDGPTGGASDG